MNYLPIDIVNAAIHLQKLRNSKYEERLVGNKDINKDLLTRNKSSKLLFDHESVFKNVEKYRIEELTSLNAPLVKTVIFLMIFALYLSSIINLGFTKVD